MGEHEIAEALSSDSDFEQAGFRQLLCEVVMAFQKTCVTTASAFFGAICGRTSMEIWLGYSVQCGNEISEAAYRVVGGVGCGRGVALCVVGEELLVVGCNGSGAESFVGGDDGQILVGYAVGDGAAAWADASRVAVAAVGDAIGEVG
jgi:hypothetical protein